MWRDYETGEKKQGGKPHFSTCYGFNENLSRTLQYLQQEKEQHIQQRSDNQHRQTSSRCEHAWGSNTYCVQQKQSDLKTWTDKCLKFDSLWMQLKPNENRNETQNEFSRSDLIWRLGLGPAPDTGSLAWGRFTSGFLRWNPTLTPIW